MKQYSYLCDVIYQVLHVVRDCPQEVTKEDILSALYELHQQHSDSVEAVLEAQATCAEVEEERDEYRTELEHAHRILKERRADLQRLVNTTTPDRWLEQLNELIMDDWE